LVIEEGSGYAGIGGELIAALAEQTGSPFTARRISAYPVPIPSVKSLENSVLPDKTRILDEIKTSFQ
jgi:pyruvate/2-oxoglutarate/acetoin dehydrogenase E1 component